ncbi:DEAD/DEAH box helicase [Helicobacter jaachi]|uniref:DEAD/DEAH box helicase n=1 Tax=Helicobacter jaachi TaxID=1677920 RepID=A0A4V6YSB7_9HELI|nr:DEAD/DEAH box helicase [Helicobacter jaachi]TLD97782.1 DEAD/DEAH box helicase [Helicobacter jaachi]
MDNQSQSPDSHQNTHKTDSESTQLKPQKELADSKKPDSKQEGFEVFKLKDFVLKGIKEAGFTTPSPVQAQSIPAILQGKDLIAQAQTGTGKTAAFVIPILNGLSRNKDIEALIITPTRELTMQISEEILKLGRYGRIKTICMYGGQSIKRQCDLLEKKPKIMVATPGRLLDHLQNGRLEHFSPRVVVLDESDEMLDMGFLDDIEEIFKFLPNTRQTLLFSATMPEPIKQLAMRILDKPTFVKITPTDVTNKDIEQQYYIINEGERDEAIVRLIETQNPTKSIIFTRMKKEADALATRLVNRGFKAMALHGDMEQWDRREAIKAFKEKRIEILVATDVASRGLDISDVSHVFNYHIPLNPESYVHRIGRTGRAGKKGVAITLATPLEYKDLSKIKQITQAKLTLCEIAQEYSGDLFSQELSRTKVSDKSVAIYEKLKDKIDTTQLCLKLISLYLEKNNNFKIGLSKEQIAKLEEEHQSDKSNKKPAKTSSKNASRHDKHDRNARYDKNDRAKHNKKKRYDDIDRSQPYTGSIWG